MCRRFLSCFLALLLLAVAVAGQTLRADRIRQQVGRIGVLGNVTVSMAGGPEYYGSISRIGADDFSIQEVDQGREIAIRYGEVKKVREGYGTTRNIRGRRIHPRTKLIVTLAVVGGLLALVFIAVATDKS